MTALQKLKWLILEKYKTFDSDIALPEITLENIDKVYDGEDVDYALQDAKEEIRGTGIHTEIPAPYSRNYESQSVAKQCPDGSWVGWTYWYGGGKYGEPEAINWMDDAYDLNCTEKQELVTVRTFTKKG